MFNWLYLFILKRKRHRTILFVIFLLPILILTTFYYISFYHELTKSTLDRRLTVAHLAATTVYSQLDGLAQLGSSLTTRNSLVEYIQQNNWEKAIATLETVPMDYPKIDRIILINTKGTLMADYPPRRDLWGENFNYRDWYIGVMKHSPYISTIYRRAAQPQYNVFSVATIIRSDNGQNIGILLLQTRIESLYAWLKDVDVGKNGYMYVVDQAGQIVAHPKHPPQDDIVNYRSNLTVQQIMKHESGVIQNDDDNDGEPEIIAYESVPTYHWGIVVAQPLRDAFITRDTILVQSLVINCSILVIYILLITMLIDSFRTLKSYANDLEKKVEERTAVLMRQSQDLQKFKMAVEETSDQVVITDSEGVILYANSSLEKITGFKREEALGKKAGSNHLWGGNMDASFYQHMWKCIKVDKKVFTGEVFNRRKNGEEYTAEIRVFPLLDNHNNIKFFVSVERDISKIKEVDKMKSEFLNIAAHDLRTPATAIKGYISMVLEGDSGPISSKTKKLLRGAYEGNERLVHLVDDFLAVSRLERGKMKIEPANMDLVRSIAATIQQFIVAKKNKKVKLLYKKTSVPLVYADEEKIIEVLTNLIENAFKFTEKGSITVSHDLQKNLVVTHVTDTGIGIAYKDQEHIFEKFNARNVEPTQQGLGLGLHICKLIIEASGGTIWVTSNPGKGTTLSFTLPIAKAVKK